VGTYKDGRYVEPPPLQTSMYLFLAPLVLSAVPVFLVKNMWLQWAAGVAVILGAYMALIYTSGKTA